MSWTGAFIALCLFQVSIAQSPDTYQVVHSYPHDTQAFTQGLHVVFAVSAAVVLGAAVLAAIQLRHLRPAPEPSETEPDGRKTHVA